MAPVLRDPMGRLVHWVDQGPARVLVALAGLPGAGKSTVAAQWQAQVQALRGPQAIQVLGMDGFHYSRAELLRQADPESKLARRGAPWTFDAPALRARLLSLRESTGAPVPWPGFDHAQGDPVPDALWVQADTRVVLVEGLYLLLDDTDWRLGDVFDERWYWDLPLELAQHRLCLRHMQAWGLSREQALQRMACNDLLNAHTVLATRERANVWVQP